MLVLIFSFLFFFFFQAEDGIRDKLVTGVQTCALPPVLLLHGPDSQLLDDALALVADRLFPDTASAAFGREVFDGRETDAQTVVTSAMTLPLLGGLRLVIVRHAQALGQRHAEALGAYARDPNPTTRLVLVADEGLRTSRDRRADHWLVQALPAGALVDLPAPPGPQLAGGLPQRAAAEGLQVSEEATRLLIEWVGEDGAVLLGEVRKAALAGGADNRSVGVNEVGAIVGERRLADVFELTRAVQRRDCVLALKTLERLLTTEEPMRMLALLARDLRMAWTVRTLDRKSTRLNSSH